MVATRARFVVAALAALDLIERCLSRVRLLPSAKPVFIVATMDLEMLIVTGHEFMVVMPKKLREIEIFGGGTALNDVNERLCQGGGNHGERYYVPGRGSFVLFELSADGVAHLRSGIVNL